MNNRFQNMPVNEYTSPSAINAKPDFSLDDMLKIMQENGIRHLPVVENNEPVGVISQRDLLFASKFKSKDNLTAREIMTAEPYIVNYDERIDKVAFEMSKYKMGSAIVRLEGGDIGIFTVTDALNALIEIIRGETPADL